MKKRTFLEASPNATKPASKRRKVELEDDDPPAGDDGNDAKRDGKITAKNAARPTGRPRKRIKAQPIDNDNDKKEGDLEQSSPARKAKANAQSSPKPASKRGQKAASPKAYKSSGKETKQTTPKAESKDEGKQSKRSGSTKKASPEESEKGQNKWKRFHKPRTVTPDPLDCRLPRRFELLSPAVKALDSGSVLRLKRVPRMTAEESAACLHVLDTISAIEDADIFFEPVNPVALRIPHYRRIVKHPLSFSELRWRLSRHGYGSIKAFVVELRHVFDNCWTFNPPVSARMLVCYVCMLGYLCFDGADLLSLLFSSIVSRATKSTSW